jgi:hypothetical protein
MAGPFASTDQLTPLEGLLNSVVTLFKSLRNSGRITGVTLTTGQTAIDTPSTAHGCTGTPEVIGAMFGTTTSAQYDVHTKSVNSTSFVLTITRSDGGAMTGQVRDLTWIAVVPN